MRGRKTIDIAVDDPRAKFMTFFVDGTFKAISNTAPYSFTWDTSDSPDGEYVLEARAEDENANFVTATRTKVWVDNAGQDSRNEHPHFGTSKSARCCCSAGRGTPDESRSVNAQAAALIEELARRRRDLDGPQHQPAGHAAPDAGATCRRARRRTACRRCLSPRTRKAGASTAWTRRTTPGSPSLREIGQTGDPGTARRKRRRHRAGTQKRRHQLGLRARPGCQQQPATTPSSATARMATTPALVARLGAAAVRGFQEDAGILACGKHFPGHGDTDTDSHLALPRIPHDRARLEAVELVPFRAAIGAGLAAIMTSHILFPALDPRLPATLSPAILTGLLRREMGFDGLIITDCLEMKGVADGWGSAEAAVLAVQAGADILLCCHTWATQRAIRDALLRAVQTGRIAGSRLDESLARIAAAKEQWVRLTMPAKVCPRCGEQYEDLKSATCPQCFARLLVVDEATAEELAAARAAVEQTPEFQAAKAEDDERFREQSFGACLGVLGIFVATAVLIVVLIVFAIHRYGQPPREAAAAATAGLSGNRRFPLTPLPVAGATLAEVMPARGRTVSAPHTGSGRDSAGDHDAGLSCRLWCAGYRQP